MSTMQRTTGMTTVVIMTLILALMTSSSSANLRIACRQQCRSEDQRKAQCIEEHGCRSLPTLNEFWECTQPCKNIGNNCFQRCAYKTDDISAKCSRFCGVSDPANAMSVPGDVSSGGSVGGVAGGAGGDGGMSAEDSKCYKSCYDTLLNIVLNRLYRKNPM